MLMIFYILNSSFPRASRYQQLQTGDKEIIIVSNGKSKDVVSDKQYMQIKVDPSTRNH